VSAPEPCLPESGPRLPLVPADATDAQLAAVFDVFRDHGRDVPTLYRTLGNSPAMLAAWVGMAWPLRNESVTSRGLRELIIMRVAQLTRATYEWLAHWDMAVHHGIDDGKLAALGSWRTSELFSPAEREVLAMTDDLTDELEVGDETWAALADRYQPGEIIELVLTASYYSCVSRVLRTLRLPVDETDPRLAML
jgi:4-carboxymuconolactone decarboxylase